MGTPVKSIKLSSRHLSKEEIQVRSEMEDKLKGSDTKLTAPKHLSTKQKKIFNTIVNELKASGILGNLDVFLLETCSISIDRLQEIEQLINENIENLFNKQLMSAKEKYSKDFFRCCNELSLSPQSRAKLGVITMEQKRNSADPLLKLLNGE